MRRHAASERGAALVEALAAVAVLGAAALGAASLAQRAAGVAAEAARLDLAREAGQAVHARLDTVGWYRLPEVFRAAPTDAEATVASGDGAPSDWEDLLAPLPRGRIQARLTGLARGGGAAPFLDAVALRIDVRVIYDDGGRRRVVALSATRF
ncbi:MAG: hypothetical protein MUC67_00275 [Acidobacteria bacterium]|jgi:hypothetical protein|nr:hypothetical protein [Acidobacteriota bacterium]MCU0253136.1 hypothetical protein [Acidobacteriota bacterium]